jgi:hypothetical protein
LELRKKKDVMSEEQSDEFHVFPETRRRAETIQSRYTATKGKSPEILLTFTNGGVEWTTGRQDL